MADVVRLSPVPRVGDTFIDARGDERSMRVSLHPDRDIAVVSLWSGTTCRATFQLPLNDAARLADLLRSPDADHEYPGLAATPGDGAEGTRPTGVVGLPELPRAS